MAYFQHLRLTDFRSYDALDLRFDSRPVVLFGANGAGKTNLLEALSCFSAGRGLRRAATKDMGRLEAGERRPAWGVVAEIINGPSPDCDLAERPLVKTADEDIIKVAIGQIPEAPGRKIVRIDGRSTNLLELSNYIRMMWLTPNQDRLFSGGAGERRKFIDRFSLIHNPTHGQHAIRYEKARTQRNRLLSDGIHDPQWYDALETEMAIYGSHMAITRTQTVASLKATIKSLPPSAFPQADLALEGDIETLAYQGLSHDHISDQFKALLSDHRAVDIRAGRSLKGIHKSDLVVRHAEKNMPAENCSTGEQKALLIGLILAHARGQSDQRPVLLLDEVTAHLDDERRGALIEDLVGLGTQIFMTGTDALFFKNFKSRAQFFHVHEGDVHPFHAD